MARRHVLRPGDPASVAERLDELLAAHGGAEPFDEACLLVVAKLAQEREGARSFLAGATPATAPALLTRWLEAARARWPEVVEPGARCHLGGAALVRVGALLEQLHLGAGELAVLDALFEQLVTRAAKGQKGQFFTPRHVVAELVALLEPEAGESVVDPACGSGAFLFHAGGRGKRVGLWGFDVDPRAVRLARLLFVACGREPGHVLRLDSLERRAITGADAAGLDVGALRTASRRARLVPPSHFDVVLTNPPFAGDVGATFASEYELARGHRVERDVLFLERCVELLRPGGRLAIVLPHNKLGGARWAFVRQWLLAQARVVAVLGLGRHTFLPHTAQKACVVIAVKRRAPLRAPPPDEHILFFVSERDGKDARGRLVLRADGAGVDHDLGEARPQVRERLTAARAAES